ncbi:glycosyltransferase family 43 domain-containing protein [Ditylenchus destructor]|uniref:Galactosylgalactosylxylosylprotein 3-beta-glucuronosyltransferase n=1 Tax=Ditylenchus destructor TaxID=166010 RepID=A0AAD4R9S7_9BILA|nr:glycosyltransferase family 43 domain-containing protein [Ditylenchus destructor]
MVEHIVPKILIAIGLFTAYQLVVMWGRLADMSENKLTLSAEVDFLTRKKENLQRNIIDLEREKHRMELRLEKVDSQVKDLLPLASRRKNLPFIFFVTPTGRRPAQKADLIRLYQTLCHVPNLWWIIVEDAARPSPFIDEILKRSKLNSVHLVALTPPEMKLQQKDPKWKKPRGVEQRNVALRWIRTNFATHQKGVVYFGDDDNTYDWTLFDEMRTVNRVGVWPVGIVGSLLVETPLLFDNVTIRGFHSVWRPDRLFPFDMAAFAVNITLILKHKDVYFSYKSQIGFQETDFLQSLNLSRKDLEPKGDYCTKVYVWHTRTEKTKMSRETAQKFQTMKGNFLEAELDAIQ